MGAEDTRLELEALHYTYAEAVIVLREQPLSGKVALTPHTGATEGSQCFTECRL